MKTLLAMTMMLFSACSSLDNFKGPGLSDPARMSAETLCYRQAYAKSDPAIASEIAARHIDCDELAPPPGEGGPF